jgi:hypothetical protein
MHACTSQVMVELAAAHSTPSMAVAFWHQGGPRRPAPKRAGGASWMHSAMVLRRPELTSLETAASAGQGEGGKAGGRRAASISVWGRVLSWPPPPQ